jgi:hypothetical protein
LARFFSDYAEVCEFDPSRRELVHLAPKRPHRQECGIYRHNLKLTGKIRAEHREHGDSHDRRANPTQRHQPGFGFEASHQL